MWTGWGNPRSQKRSVYLSIISTASRHSIRIIEISIRRIQGSFIRWQLFVQNGLLALASAFLHFTSKLHRQTSHSVFYRANTLLTRQKSSKDCCCTANIVAMEKRGPQNAVLSLQGIRQYLKWALFFSLEAQCQQDLCYPSVDQALADLAHFINTIKSDWMLVAVCRSRWIVREFSIKIVGHFC